MTTILNNNDNNNSTAITLQRELARILQEITDNQSTPDVKIFKQLLDNLRENSDDESSANEHMSIFVRLLREKKAWADGLWMKVFYRSFICYWVSVFYRLF